ncbi:MAG TPA: protein kinase [Pyrinomonadaceae bacterium]|jgi:WD40 repeat protein/predicted Ser/Thr protein kinase
MAQSQDKIGSYTLINKIGSGGFGVVWLAEKRTSIATTRFALKLARNEDVDIEVFKQEAAIWAHVSGHPNVLPIIEADIYDGQIVIVSEYAPGGSLMNWLQKHGGRAPSIEAAVEMTTEILDGLEHLHEQRIIHRDLKPDNILLQRETPRLADFGIARVIKTDSYSKAVTGTFAYMAPEAFNGKRNEQTDVWSVGIILYQMLAGRLPYDQEDIVALVGAIVGHDPPPLPDSVPESLRRIVGRALNRNPSERYQSAAEMRLDLRPVRYELWQPHSVETIPYAAVEPKTKPDEPRPVSAPVVSESSPQAPPPLPNVELTSQPVPTIAVQTSRSGASQSTVASAPLPPGISVERRRGWLTPGKAVIGVVAAIVIASLIALAAIKWLPTNTTEQAGKNSAASEQPVDFKLNQTLAGHTDGVMPIAFSPDGKTLASGSTDKTIKLWDVQTGALKQTLTGHSNGVHSLEFSPDGMTLASGSDDKTIKLWNAQTGALKQTLTAHNSAVHTIAFSPDGNTLASGSTDKTIKVWDVHTGALKQTLTGHAETVKMVAFSPDGKQLASCSDDKTIKLWDVQSGALKQTLTGHSSGVHAIAFSPDGKLIASGSIDMTIKLWDVQTGALKQTLAGHSNGVHTIAFSPDGRLLASGSNDKTIKLWDVQSGALKQTLSGHTDPVMSVTFSPGGKLLASGSMDKTIKLWTEP